MNYLYQEPLRFDRGVGVVLGSFSPLHKGHLDLIYQAKKECIGGALVVVCGYNQDKGWPKMTLKERYQMVREYFKTDPLVAVYCLSDDEMGIAEYASNQDEWRWDIWLDHLEKDIIRLNSRSDTSYKNNIVFYTGEESYARDLGELGYRTKLVDRDIHPITGTMIRNNVIKYWHEIAWTYHRKFSHNILVTGTASEGKTTLVEDIGRYFNLPYSYEWPRTYMNDHNVCDWELDGRDFVSFLEGQYTYNRGCIESKHNNGIFLADTDTIITKMYAKYYAMDPDMAMTMDEYEEVVEPVADMFIRRSNWDKIFVILPKSAEFVDDHARYMKHGTMKARNELATILMEEIKKAGWIDKVQILTGGYKSNFEIVKSYINEIGGMNNG